MIRVLAVTMLLSVPAVAKDSRRADSPRHFSVVIPPVPPIPPMPPVPPMPPMPEMPQLPDFPAMEADFSGMEADFSGMKAELEELHAGLPRLFADAHPRGRRDRDADDDEKDEDRDEDASDREALPNGVHVYRMDQQRVNVPQVRVRQEDRDERSDESEATAQARGRGAATLAVKGPITLQVRAQAGELEVVSSDRQQVAISLSDSPQDEVALLAFGDRVEPSFRGRRILRHGKLHVELPRGSRLDVSSMSGDISAQGVGDARIRTMSGDVKLTGVAKCDVQSISGDVRIAEAAGPVRLHVVSGRAVVQTTGTAPQLEFQSASGNLEWAGTCGRDCRVSAETVSGDVRLAVDPRSSFELSYTSHGGELRDELNLAVKRAPGKKHGMNAGWLEATYGNGEGVIEADAFSGSLVVTRR